MSNAKYRMFEKDAIVAKITECCHSIGRSEGEVNYFIKTDSSRKGHHSNCGFIYMVEPTNNDLYVLRLIFKENFMQSLYVNVVSLNNLSSYERKNYETQEFQNYISSTTKYSNEKTPFRRADSAFFFHLNDFEVSIKPDPKGRGILFIFTRNEKVLTPQEVIKTNITNIVEEELKATIPLQEADEAFLPVFNPTNKNGKNTIDSDEYYIPPEEFISNPGTNAGRYKSVEDFLSAADIKRKFSKENSINTGVEETSTFDLDAFLSNRDTSSLSPYETKQIQF